MSPAKDRCAPVNFCCRLLEDAKEEISELRRELELRISTVEIRHEECLARKQAELGQAGQRESNEIAKAQTSIQRNMLIATVISILCMLISIYQSYKTAEQNRVPRHEVNPPPASNP